MHHSRTIEPLHSPISYIARNDDNNVKVAAAGGIEVIVTAMKNHQASAAVQQNGCGALVDIAVNDDNKMKVVAARGMEVILTAMNNHQASTKIQQLGCRALSYIAVTDGNLNKLAAASGLEIIGAVLTSHGNIDSIACVAAELYFMLAEKHGTSSA